MEFKKEPRTSTSIRIRKSILKRARKAKINVSRVADSLLEKYMDENDVPKARV